MACLLDTCILLRAFDRTAPEQFSILQALRMLGQQGVTLTVTVQNLAEFWNVSTRPSDRNGYGLAPEQTCRRMAVIERFAHLLVESTASYQAWKELVARHAVCGVQAHDARLVSVMQVERIPTIMTLNRRDFARYPGIEIITP